MIYFQEFLTAISILQVPNLSFNLHGAEDAKTSLRLLSDKIESSTDLVSSIIPSLWKYYGKSAEEETQEDFYNLLGNFNSLLANITEFGANITGADECTVELKQTLPGLLSAINGSTTSSQEDIFVNLQSLASTEISKIGKQFKYLQAEYDASCGETDVNCDGTSKSIVAEVERLLGVIQRKIYDFTADAAVLLYELNVDGQLLHAYLASHFDTGVQNITACIASKIEQSSLEQPRTNTQQPYGNISILESYTNLVYLSGNTTLRSRDSLLVHVTNLIRQSNIDYLATLANIRDAVFLANQTIISLQNLATEFNVTLNCAIPDLHSILNSSISRALEEYTDVGVNRLSLIYREGLNNLNVTQKEVSSIGLQIRGCSDGTTCDYLVDKIDRMAIELPVTLTSLGNATAVLMYQSVSSVRKSGYIIVRDALEQSGAGIVGLKACVKASS